MRTLLREITDVVHRITAPGAALNAMYEVDLAVSSMVELEARLRQVETPSSPSSQAA